MQYRVNIGLNYPPEKRAEPGDIIEGDDLGSVADLVAQGSITAIDATAEAGPVSDTGSALPVKPKSGRR